MEKLTQKWCRYIEEERIEKMTIFFIAIFYYNLEKKY